MPTHIPAELKLDVPLYEEDISDLSPYSVPLSGLRTTINSSYSTTSSLTGHEIVSGIPYSGNDIHRMLVLGTPMRDMFNVDIWFIVFIFDLPTQNYRQATQTVPPSKELRKLQVEIGSLTMDPAVVVKMRRWVLAFAVGVYVLSNLISGLHRF